MEAMLESWHGSWTRHHNMLGTLASRQRAVSCQSCSWVLLKEGDSHHRTQEMNSVAAAVPVRYGIILMISAYAVTADLRGCWA